MCQIKSKAQDKMDLEDNIKNINFNKLRGKLNIILLSQYLLSTGHLISQGDLAHIQNTDRDINSLKKQCEGGNENYLIKNDILYKNLAQRGYNTGHFVWLFLLVGLLFIIMLSSPFFSFGMAYYL